MKKILLSLPLLIISTSLADAHCPLCTVGAGAAAGVAAWLGVSKIIIALFIGAFAMSMGMWFAGVIKKRYVPFQRTLIIASVFLATVLPLLPIFRAIGPLYIPFIGEYGIAYAFNYSLASSFLGGVITFVSPKINKKIKEKRNGKGLPFQGILLTFLLLGLISAIIQVIV